MIGTIGFKALKIECIVGIYPHEREAPQELFIDLEVDRDFGPAAASDNISDTIDYDHIAGLLTELATGRQYRLIETFAEEAVGLMFDRHPDVVAVRLEIRKPAAVREAECAFVRVERTR